MGLQGKGYGYLDRELNLAIAPRYDRANPFSSGMASARRGGRWYLIDRQDRVVPPCEYDVPPLGFCHETQRFIFRRDSKYGVKDYSGHTVWPAVYDRIHSLDTPFPVVGHGNRECPVTARGKPILPSTYDSVHWFSDKRHFCTHRDGICEMYDVQER